MAWLFTISGMSFSEFIALDEADRYGVLWKEGVFLMNIRHHGSVRSLYGVYGFYIEVIMDGGVTEIVDLIAFERGKRLDKYIAMIKFKDEKF